MAEAAPMTGQLSFLDNTVDSTSGTIKLKARLSNPAQALWPGQYVTVRLTLRTLKDVAVLPQAALIIKGEAREVYVVGADQKATLRPVTVLNNDGAWAAVSGVKPGEQVVMEGKENLRPGGSVHVMPAAPAAPAASALGCRSRRMSLTELFIRRPVMTVLLNIAIVIGGLLALDKIPVAALPRFDTPVINVNASLPGASPETMASSVALPLEKQFSTIAGLSLISSSSSLGSTSLTLEFDASRDIDAAALDVQAALFRAQRSLPDDMTTPPSYRKVNPADAPVLFVALTSPSISLTQLNDYAENLISPSLSTLEGVAQVAIYGQRRYAVRVEVDLDRLAERNLTLDELRAVLTSANANTPVGTLDGPRQTLTVQANRQLMNATDWRQVIVATRNGAPVRLADVAQVQDSVESTKTYAELNGEPSITLAIQRQPDANTVQVVDRVKAMLPRFAAQLPASVKMTPVNDRSRSIREAVHDVYFTLALTVVLVVLVIFLFLRRLSATLIPSFSLPISLIGALALLWAGGYSLDNISLLGITLAVGLVVDDAIVMLENIVRHVEDGMEPFAAAVRGAR
jgi:HAE1 family hydrophobic/amphiphilic exporter-1